MGEWYSALGGGVVLDGHEIYRRIRAVGETYALGMAASASWELADRYVERVTRINALTQKMDAAWQGAASAGAASAMRPVTRALEDAQSLLLTSRDAFADQASGYWRAFREVQYVPPAKDPFDGFGPESDIDRAIADRNDKAHRNVMVYNGYHHQSVANGDRMPVSYPTVPSADGSSVTVSGDGPDPTAEHRSDSGRPGTNPAGAMAQSAGGGTGPGTADADGQPVRGGAVVPPTGGGSATGPQGWAPQGWAPQGALVPSGQAGGAPVEPRPGGTGGGGAGAPGGWGPTPLGTGRSVGWGPDARGGVGPVPPPSGGVVGRPAPDGRGGPPRPATGTHGGSAHGGSGLGGSALGGGLWGPYPSRPDDDREHYRRYGHQFDSDDLFGIDVVVAPSVIGAEPVDGDEDEGADGRWFGYGDTDEN